MTAAPTTEINKRKFYTMIGIMIFMVVGFVTEFISAAMTATVAGVLCIVTGCVTQKKAISSINWNVLGRLGLGAFLGKQCFLVAEVPLILLFGGQPHGHRFGHIPQVLCMGLLLLEAGDFVLDCPDARCLGNKRRSLLGKPLSLLRASH